MRLFKNQVYCNKPELHKNSTILAISCSSPKINHHSVDLLLEIRGQLPADRQRLLDIMDRFLSLSESRQTNFIMGRRLGYYRTLDDQARKPDFLFVEKQVKKALAPGHGSLEDIFHHLRIQVI
jgi:hypothetical protein